MSLIWKEIIRTRIQKAIYDEHKMNMTLVLSLPSKSANCELGKVYVDLLINKDENIHSCALLKGKRKNKKNGDTKKLPSVSKVNAL